MHSYRKMLEWKPEDPFIEIVAVTMWEKCGEGQELYELLVRQDGLSHCRMHLFGPRGQDGEG